MIAIVKFYKVKALPQHLTPNAFYVIPDGDNFQMYVVDNKGAKAYSLAAQGNGGGNNGGTGGLNAAQVEFAIQTALTTERGETQKVLQEAVEASLEKAKTYADEVAAAVPRGITGEAVDSKLVAAKTTQEAYADGKLDEAKAYTDSAVAKIVIPDVDGKIAAAIKAEEAKRDASIDSKVHDAYITLEGGIQNLKISLDNATAAAKKYTDDQIAAQGGGGAHNGAHNGATTEYVNNKVSQLSTDLKTYTDNAVAAAPKGISSEDVDKKLATTKTTQEAYADSKLVEAKQYADTQIAAVPRGISGEDVDKKLAAAKTVQDAYTDSKFTDAKTYTDNAVASVPKGVSTEYVGFKISEVRRDYAAKDAELEKNDTSLFSQLATVRGDISGLRGNLILRDWSKQGLVVNGSGMMGNNINFPNTIFHADDAPFGGGSFEIQTKSKYPERVLPHVLTEHIYINPNRQFSLQMFFKNMEAEKAATIDVYLLGFDFEGKPIMGSAVYGSDFETTVAADCPQGGKLSFATSDLSKIRAFAQGYSSRDNLKCVPSDKLNVVGRITGRPYPKNYQPVEGIVGSAVFISTNGTVAAESFINSGETIPAGTKMRLFLNYSDTFTVDTIGRTRMQRVQMEAGADWTPFSQNFGIKDELKQVLHSVKIALTFPLYQTLRVGGVGLYEVVK